jgi:hypothetical protein
MGGLRSNHRGEVGGCVLWLAARVAQYRCKSEWTHLIFAGTSASTLTIGSSW